MENLFAENFPGLFTNATKVDYMLAEIVIVIVIANCKL